LINIQDKAKEHDHTSNQLIQHLPVWCDLCGFRYMEAICEL